MQTITISYNFAREIAKRINGCQCVVNMCDRATTGYPTRGSILDYAMAMPNDHKCPEKEETSLCLMAKKLNDLETRIWKVENGQ